jgi:hypothetical protein
MGARGQAMGNATTCNADEWSILNNVAGLAETTAPTLAVSYDALPAMPALGKVGLALSLPGTVSYGLGLYRFGDAVYNEQIVTGGVATKWNHTALGLNANYVRYAADGLGSKGVFSISAGGITRVTSWLKVGAHIVNINQPWLSKQYDERLPTTLSLGLLFTLAPQALLVAEVNKRINDVATGHTGLEFMVHKKLTARVGFQINPQSLTGGLGFHLRYFTVDYSMAHTPAFGTRQQASISLKLNKARSKSEASTKTP